MLALRNVLSDIRGPLRIHIPLARPLLNFAASLAIVPHHATGLRFLHGVRTMAPVSRINLPLHLVFDFDGTLTRRDTMHLVAEAGYSHQSASGRVPQLPPWSEIVEAYMTDFRAHVTNYMPQADERTLPKQELAWLNSLEQIEESSFQRALVAGIFDHLTGVEMEGAGNLAFDRGRLQLRPSWHELAMRVQRHNKTYSEIQPPISILSVNWSAAFIRGVLQQASGDQTEVPLIQPYHIYANEIPSVAERCVTSSNAAYQSYTENAPLRTSGDKSSLLQKFRPITNDKEKPLLVYVGDSTTDLGCLLAADFGFCIRDDPMTSGQKELAETCRRIGVGVHPIAEASGRSDEKTLWWVHDFSEIVHWLDRSTNA